MLGGSSMVGSSLIIALGSKSKCFAPNWKNHCWGSIRVWQKWPLCLQNYWKMHNLILVFTSTYILLFILWVDVININKNKKFLKFVWPPSNPLNLFRLHLRVKYLLSSNKWLLLLSYAKGLALQQGFHSTNYK